MKPGRMDSRSNAEQPGTSPESLRGPEFQSNLPRRHRFGALWRFIFQASTVVGILTLVALLFNIINSSFGYVAFDDQVDAESLAVNGVSLAELSEQELVRILQENVSTGLFRQIGREKPVEERSREELLALIQEKVIKPEVVKAWTLYDSIFKVDEIQAEAAEDYPEADVRFYSWIDLEFVSSPQNSNPLVAGIRTAILGSLFTIAITIVIAFPMGVGAAIYLEEYARDNALNRLIQTNINNLAGVPSIIYGILGLALFVRLLEPLTSGSMFGVADPTTANGRTILSAGLTLALLILPIVIINAQEAIRAVPNALREASFGLGGTKWQTIWHHVLPYAVPGILTGTILAISRAIGETAPLVVIGASTFISFDPTGPFSKFTTLPIQIYQWVSRPQQEFHSLAAAAIIILLLLLLSLNTAAILLRNRFSRRLS